MRVTIFIVYGGIHVVVHLDGKIERRKSSPYPEWPPGASLGRLAQAGGVEKLQKVKKDKKSKSGRTTDDDRGKGKGGEGREGGGGGGGRGRRRRKKRRRKKR